MSARIKMMLSFALLLFVLQPGIVKAAAQADFSITVSNGMPKVGEEISVIVHGESLSELFGYEANVTYSPDQLTFLGASSLLEDGFAVPPTVNGGKIVYAYTKIGAATSSINGAADLASFKFKVISSGTIPVKLTRLKVVNKNSMASEFLLSSIINVQASHFFIDVPEAFWANEAISRAADLGIVKGYSDGTFRPLGEVTREEFVTMLARALQLSNEPDAAGISFKDESQISKWAIADIQNAAAAGWIKGFEDGTFRPDSPVTRTEMIVMASRAIKLDVAKNKPLLFADAAKIPVWAKPYIAAAVEEGIVKGRSNNQFVPFAASGRAEAVTMVLNSFDYIKQANLQPGHEE